MYKPREFPQRLSSMTGGTLSSPGDLHFLFAVANLWEPHLWPKEEKR